MAADKIKYVQLEAAAWVADPDWQMMTAEERGVYSSLILCLYANDGVIQLAGNGDITLLSKKTQGLGVISGCGKTGQEWEYLWSRMRHKFLIEGNLLTHKRVTAELAKAAAKRRAASKAGKKGMEKRWGGDNGVITNRNRKEYKNTNTETESIDVEGDSVRRSGKDSPERGSGSEKRRVNAKNQLVDILQIPLANKSEVKTFAPMFEQFEERILLGELPADIYDEILREARECRTARNPRAAFTARMKKEPYNYKRGLFRRVFR